MKIDINDQKVPFIKTSFIEGAFRSGKTWFAGTFPRVAWLGSTREGGHVTLQFMDPSAFYEPNVPPQIYSVETKNEMLDHLHRDIVPQVKSGRIRTIALELTFYTDDIIRNANPGDNGWEKYKMLEDHINWVDDFCKKLPPRTLIHYNTLAAAADDAKIPGGAVIAGRALAKKLPAIMNLIGYLRSKEAKEKGATPERFLHLNVYGPFAAGHRYGNRLPNVVKNPTYRKLEDLLAGRAICDGDGNVLPVESVVARVTIDLAPRGQNPLAPKNALAPNPVSANPLAPNGLAPVKR